MRVCESVVMNIGTTSRRALVARRDFLFRKPRLRLTGCRSSPQKATLGSAARLQAPSLTPHCRYQLFAEKPSLNALAPPQKPCARRALQGAVSFGRTPPFHFRFIARRRALSSGEMQRDSSIFWIALLYVQSSNAVVSRKANVLSRYFAIAVAAAHAAPIL